MPRRSTEPTPETPLEELWNLSDTTAAWLRDLGVQNYGDLSQRDLHELWSELTTHHRQVSKLMFYALWGAVHNCHWKQIPPTGIEAFEAYRARLT